MTNVVLAETTGPVLVITLNRPEVRNAIDSMMSMSLLGAVEMLDEQDDLAVAVITGAGGNFCAGMDLKAFAADGLPRGLPAFFERGARKPLLCAVEGFALAGGLEVALTCDLIVAGRDARFGIPEVSVGLFPAGGALFRLPQRVPYGVAVELALTAEPITAEDAFRYGLVSRLTEPGQALRVALDLAARIARNAPIAVATTKQLLRGTAGRTESEFWELQRPMFEQVFTSGEAREGALAFGEKRAPNWSSS